MAITATRRMRFPICMEAFLHLDVDFLNASRFPVRDREAMSFKHKFGNWMLSLAMSLLYFRWVRDSQSGMWVFRRSILKDMHLESDGMSFSEEIKIEALKRPAGSFRRDLHHVLVAPGRNQIESMAGRILQLILPGEEALQMNRTEKTGWQAKAPAPRACKVGQTLSSANPTGR